MRRSIRASTYRRILGISFNESNRLSIEQETARCEVCDRANRVYLDHNHKTMKIRGWLCQKCNGALGMLDESHDNVCKLSVYLEKHPE